MTASSWQLFRAAVLVACGVGVGLAIVVYLAVFVLQDPGSIGGIAGAALVGLVAGAAHGLIAALAGLLARRTARTDRWTILAAVGAVLLAWATVVVVVAAGGPGTGVVAAPLAAAGAAAALLTAACAHVVLRRVGRPASA